MALRRQVLRLAARALEQKLNADTSDHAGPGLPCSCGESVSYHGRHWKTFESVLGSLQRGDQLITSAMSVGEILVKPQERQDHNLCRQYEEAITSTAAVTPASSS